MEDLELAFRALEKAILKNCIMGGVKQLALKRLADVEQLAKGTVKKDN